MVHINAQIARRTIRFIEDYLAGRILLSELTDALEGGKKAMSPPLDEAEERSFIAEFIVLDEAVAANDEQRMKSSVITACKRLQTQLEAIERKFTAG